MKHLFLILFASLGLTAFAQNTVSTLPQYQKGGGEKRKTTSVENTVVRKDNSAITADGRLTKAIVRPGNVASAKDQMLWNANPQTNTTLKLTGVRRIDSDKAKITLMVLSDWGKGDGFEVWLDNKCEIENDFCDNSVGYQEVFAKTTYVIPEGATPEKGFLQTGGEASIEIPAGKYDFLVVNPTPNEEEKLYMVRADTDSHGDDVTFVGGYEYIFTVQVTISGVPSDMSSLTANSNIDLRVTDAPSPLNGELTDEETVSMTIRNWGSEPCSHIIATYRIDDGAPVTEMADLEIPAKGGMVTYTFNTKADLSKSGSHKIEVSVQGEGEALVLESNRYTKYVMNTSTAIPAPYTCDFTEEEDKAEWNSIDADNDNYRWQIETGRAYSWNCYNDYLVTASPITLAAGTNTIEITYRSMLNDPKDKFEVLFGKTNDVKEMTVLKTFSDYATVAQLVDAIEFETPDDGNYYFAFHACPTGADMPCTDILNVKIYEGSNKGVPDLRIDKVVVPTSACGVEFDKIDVQVSNIGSGPVNSFNLTAVCVGDEFVSDNFEVEIPANGNATVSLEIPEGKRDYFKEAGRLYSITVNATYVTSESGVEEVNTENNSDFASFVNFEEAKLPFISDFTNSDNGRYYWYGPEGWSYNTTVEAYQAITTTPLVSRGIQLKAGKTYRLNYNRRAGMDYYGIYTFKENYKIMCGPNGEDPSTWKIIKQQTNDYSDEDFGETGFEFTVPSDGLYQFAFQMDYINQGFTFYLRDVSITELIEHNVKIGSVGYLPTRVPKTQTGEFEARVPVTNNGSAAASGKVTMSINGNVIGEGSFTDIPTGETKDVVVYATIDGEIGTNTINIVAQTEGEPEEYLYDNSENVDILITEDLMAYDKIADGTYYGGQPDNREVATVGVNGGEFEAGIIFHLNNDAKLKGVSVGWGTVGELEVDLTVYKWTNPETDDNGYYPLPETTTVYTTKVNKSYDLGQEDYLINDDVTLPAGDYLISAGVTTGYPLATDRKTPGQFYLIGDWGVNYSRVAVDRSYGAPGTAAIRAILAEDDGTSISSVESGSASLSLYPNPASENLNITAGEGQITNVAIYSTSGAVMHTANVNGNSYSCNVSSYAPGIYFAKVTVDGKAETLKFVVK